MRIAPMCTLSQNGYGTSVMCIYAQIQQKRTFLWQRLTFHLARLSSARDVRRRSALNFVQGMQYRAAAMIFRFVAASVHLIVSTSHYYERITLVHLRLSCGKKVNGTRRASQAVPHPSTDRALRRLTSEFGWDRVYSTQYGR